MRILPFALVLGLAFGCAGSDRRPLAEDVVCLQNGDLGCVKVRVDENTPKTEYRGKTYYFCSTRCRVLFEQDPEKFVRDFGR
jgi:YHS domain-containing protein